MSILDGFYSLGADVNKAKGADQTDDTVVGAVGDYLPELTLAMKDDDLIKLTEKWEERWTSSSVRANWLKQVEDNENYWRGKQYNKLETEQLRPLVDNIVFQAVETYLPAATRQNPEPLISLRATEKETDDNLAYAKIIRDRCADWADDVRLRLKLKKAGRNWLLSMIGVGKMGWDLANNRPALKIIRPKKLILDPDGVTDEDGYNGKFVGEHRKMEASILVQLVSDNAEAVTKIKDLAKNDMGTDIQFIEWWTDDYMCWTVDKFVLLKKKNPHFNYDPAKETKASAPEEAETPTSNQGQTSGETDSQPTPLEPTAETPSQKTASTDSSTTGESGQMPETPDQNTPQMDAQPTGPALPNHFNIPRKPYVWISIFNLGKTPVDETSLITQILPQQDLVNKREKQIDKNADGMNGGVIVSEERSGLTKEEAKSVTDALRRGGTVIVPSGAPGDAIMRLPSQPLPPDVFAQLSDTRNRMYDLFGIRGITPAGIKNEDTVRGKIITKGLDTDRIGGGITEYFEQFADEIYNWVYQLMLVYDDLFAQHPGAQPPKLKVSVKEGSLLPKDATTKANQAIELANGGKMSLIDLYKSLEYPNPEEMAANVWLEANAPEMLFKDNPQVMQAIQMKQQQAQAAAAAGAAGAKKGPSESINFKDLPPEGKSQMAKQAGIDLTTESAMAHEAASKPAVPSTGGEGRSLLNQVPAGQHQNG